MLVTPRKWRQQVPPKFRHLPTFQKTMRPFSFTLPGGLQRSDGLSLAVLRLFPRLQSAMAFCWHADTKVQHFCITNLHNKVLLEKLAVPHLVTIFTAFCSTRRFVTVFTTACLMSLLRFRQILSTHSNFFNIYFSIIFPSTPWSSYCLRVSPAKPCKNFSSLL